MGLDMVDKQLLLWLEWNCRLSYQTLARKVGLTVSAVKKRINNLKELGIIGRFYVALNLRRYGFVNLILFLSTDGSEDKEAFIQHLGDLQPLFNIAMLVDGRYVGSAVASRAEEVLKLDRVLRRLEGITQVDLRQVTIFPYQPVSTHLSKRAIPGGSLTFTKLQTQVLRCLVEDARLPVTKVAQRTKLTPRRVRRILNELEAGGNVMFTLEWCLGADEDFDCGIITVFDSSQGAPVELVDWFQEGYPLQHWWSMIYVDEPILLHKLVVNDLRVIEEIADAVKRLPMVESVETVIYHTTRNFSGPNEIQLKQMLDLSDQ